MTISWLVFNDSKINGSKLLNMYSFSLERVNDHTIHVRVGKHHHTLDCDASRRRPTALLRTSNIDIKRGHALAFQFQHSTAPTTVKNNYV